MSARQAPPLAPSWAPLTTTIAVLLTGAIAALVWHSSRLSQVDAWALHALEARNDWAYWTARTLSLGLVALAVGAALLLAVLAWVVLRWRNAVLLSLTAPALALVVEKLLKELVERRAPGSTAFHYPSGHLAVGTAAALAVVLVVRSARTRLAVRPVGVAASLCVATMALARQVDKAHLLSDVVGGVATGVATTLALALLLDSRFLNPASERARAYEETRR